jgi:hypothetical protein
MVKNLYQFMIHFCLLSLLAVGMVGCASLKEDFSSEPIQKSAEASVKQVAEKEAVAPILDRSESAIVNEAGDCMVKQRVGAWLRRKITAPSSCIEINELFNAGVVLNQFGEHVEIFIPVSLVFRSDSSNVSESGVASILGAYLRAMIASYDVPQVTVTAFVPPTLGEYVESIGSAQAHAFSALISAPDAPAPIMLTKQRVLENPPYASRLKNGYIRVDFSFVSRHKKVA